MQYTMFKTYPKTSGGHKRKKNSSVLCKDEQSFANWPLGSSGWASWATLSSDPARLAGLCSSSSPCSASTKQGTWTAQPKPRVVSQYRPWATKATGHSHTGQGGYVWGRFGHFLSVQIKYSFFVSLLQINQGTLQFRIDCNLYLLFLGKSLGPSPSKLDLSTATGLSLLSNPAVITGRKAQGVHSQQARRDCSAALGDGVSECTTFTPVWCLTASLCIQVPRLHSCLVSVQTFNRAIPILSPSSVLSCSVLNKTGEYEYFVHTK